MSFYIDAIEAWTRRNIGEFPPDPEEIAATLSAPARQILHRAFSPVFQEDVVAAIEKWNMVYIARIRAIIPDSTVGEEHLGAFGNAPRGVLGSGAGSPAMTPAPASGALGNDVAGLGVPAGRNRAHIPSSGIGVGSAVMAPAPAAGRPTFDVRGLGLSAGGNGAQMLGFGSCL